MKLEHLESVYRQRHGGRVPKGGNGCSYWRCVASGVRRLLGISAGTHIIYTLAAQIERRSQDIMQYNLVISSLPLLLDYDSTGCAQGQLDELLECVTILRIKP